MTLNKKQQAALDELERKIRHNGIQSYVIESLEAFKATLAENPKPIASVGGFKRGDLVSDGRKAGVVSELWGESKSVTVDFHNGMKIMGYIRETQKLTHISEEEFWRKNKGNTSFYGHLEQVLKSARYR